MAPFKPLPRKPSPPEFDFISPTGAKRRSVAPGTLAPVPVSLSRSGFSPPACWRVSHVARHLEISKKRIYQLVEERKLEAIRFGPRQMRILLPSLQQYLDQLLKAEAEREP